MSRTALIAVDCQVDYLPEGVLGVPGSDRIIDPLVEYAALAADVIILSRNLHPPDHKSFEFLPPNCVKGTPGARIVADLAAFAFKPNCYVISKGLDPDKFGYSAFEGGTLRPLESLEDILAHEKVSHVAIGGYWLNGCVAQTAFDANALGYATAVESGATCTNSTTERFEELIAGLRKAGIAYV